MNAFERTLVEKVVLEHGWENIIISNASNVVAGSARHPIHTTITHPSANQWSVTFDKPLLVKELLKAFNQMPDGLIFNVDRMEQLPNILRKAAEIALALPHQAAITFQSRVKTELEKSRDTGTEVERLVKQRIGQSIFREALMGYWGGECAVTGVAIPEMLRASHVKPWAQCESDEERLDVFNGFLLSANLDALFDRGLISFDEQGTMLISSKLPKSQVVLINIGKIMRLRWIAPKHAVYLNWHREYHYEN